MACLWLSVSFRLREKLEPPPWLQQGHFPNTLGFLQWSRDGRDSFLVTFLTPPVGGENFNTKEENQPHNYMQNWLQTS